MAARQAARSGRRGMVHTAAVTEPRAPRFKDFPPLMAVKSAHEPCRAELETEKLVLRRLRDCPHVIRYLGEEETSAEDGTSRLQELFVFLELASGGTLDGLIEAVKGPLEEGVVRLHARSVLAGVKRIHDEGNVHCDLVPDNVLLVEEGGERVAKVADFSGARRAGRGGSVRGTMRYLAPEAAWFGVQDKASDIWALGCVVLRMLGGKLPWDGCDKRTVRTMIATQTPHIPEWISCEAADFLTNCFLRRPEARATATELMRHPFLCPDDDDDDDECDDDSDDDDDEGHGTAPRPRASWGRQWIAGLLEWLRLKWN